MMKWPQSNRWTAGLLSAAALLTPGLTVDAQTRTFGGTGKPQPVFKKGTNAQLVPTGPHVTTAPSMPPVEETVTAESASRSVPAVTTAAVRPTAPQPVQRTVTTPPATTTAPPPQSGETAVQRELRKLYGESGREMPQGPTQLQMKPPAALQSGPALANQVPATHQTPASGVPAAPRGKPNPVTSFFKKLTPGGNAKPAAPAQQMAGPGAAPSSNYVPYGGPQPRRLDPAATASQPLPLPPSPAAPVVAQPQGPSLTPPVVVAAPATPAPVVKAEATPVIVPKATATVQQGPVFETPLLVDANDTAVVTPVTEATPTTEASGPNLAGADASFPDPFPEESEASADDEMESPFTGVTLDEEPAVTVAPATEVVSTPAAAPKSDEEPFELPALPGDTPAAPVAEKTQEPSAGPGLDLTIQDPLTTTVQLPGTESDPLELPAEGSSSESADAVKPMNDPTKVGTEEEIYAAKMRKIRERGGMKGLKGFCPVLLRDERELKDAMSEHQATYRGQKFHFASAEAKTKFEADPARYAPAAYGADVVVLIQQKDVAEGTLDYAAWYKGRLYLFGSEETHNTFLDDPTKFATPEGLE